MQKFKTALILFLFMIPAGWVYGTENKAKIKWGCSESCELQKNPTKAICEDISKHKKIPLEPYGECGCCPPIK